MNNNDIKIMKIIFSLILGICLGLSSLFFYPQSNAMLNSTHTTLAIPQTIYSHKPEGQKIQTIEYIAEDEYKSTKGNQATLYKLDDQCKLIIGIYGEKSHAYKTIYFKQGKIIHIFETTYHNSWMKKPKYDDKDPKQVYTEMYSNPLSPLVQQEFKTLVKYINKENLKKC